MSAGTEPSVALEVTLEAHSDRFDEGDGRWRDQVADLVTSLGREVGGVRREVTPVPGSKGGAEAIVLALGSAGVFTAAVEMARSWLGRDRSRSLEITYLVDGQEQRVTVRGDAVSDEAVQAVADAAAKQIGEASWANPATKPS